MFRHSELYDNCRKSRKIASRRYTSRKCSEGMLPNLAMIHSDSRALRRDRFEEWRSGEIPIERPVARLEKTVPFLFLQVVRWRHFRHVRVVRIDAPAGSPAEPPAEIAAVRAAVKHARARIAAGAPRSARTQFFSKSGSFSAVSAPIFASQYAFFTIF